MRWFKFLFLCMILTNACAREQINIMWGFAIGSNQANTVRIMCRELNEMQDKYTFVLISKPGNSGSIAANQVVEYPENTLLGMGSTFISRPYYDVSGNAHNLDDFIPILVQATDAPLYLFSNKYSTLEEFLKAKDVTVGISGIGGLAHLVAIQLMELNPNIRVINYNSMTESATAATGQHIDTMIGFYIDVQGLVETGKLKALGHTGIKDKYHTKSFSEYGLSETRSITVSYALYASKKMRSEKFVEIHNLLSKVNQSQDVLESYKKDQLNPVNYSIEQGIEWYSKQRNFWKKESRKMNGF